MAVEHEVERKLRAILSADVKGYSLLMTNDETFTIKTLKEYRNVMSELIKAHSGRVVDAPGDNLLAEFSSAVNAVQCSVEIQNNLKERNAEQSNDKKLEYRIGVNIGDVVEDENRIYGSGVNIAARIECIAEPGGICISRNTYDQVKDKLELEYKFLGEHKAKNIKEPVRVYKVLMDSDQPKPLVKEIFELPDKPSIAVLPFDNMSGDPSQEYFSDGLTEQIINGLCKISNLFVIARNSSFAYKRKFVTVKQIARELGVKYILEGSVQKAGDRLRITAQLIDAATDYHVWSEHYDRDLMDIFILQDEITMQLISVMMTNLTAGDQARFWVEGTRNIQAYDHYMRAVDCLNRNNKRDNKQARQFFKDAFSLDGNWGAPHVGIGFTHIIDLFFGWSDSPLKSFEDTEKILQKAFTLKDSLDQAYSLSAFIHLLKREHKKAIEEGELAIDLNPNSANAHLFLGLILFHSGEIDSAIKTLKRSFRLNPIPPSYYYHALSTAYRINGEYEKAIGLAYEALKISPDQMNAYLNLVVAYYLSNQEEKAREAVQELLRISPNFSIEYLKMTLPYKHQEEVDKFIYALRKVGLPD